MFLDPMKTKIIILVTGILCGGTFFTGGYFVSEYTNNEYHLLHENKNQRAIILELEQDKIDIQMALDKKNKEYEWLSEITDSFLDDIIKEKLEEIKNSKKSDTRF